MQHKSLVNQKYVLEKFPGKGGWTFARIPEIAANKHAHFGWVKVKGTIDGYPIKQYNLMPMGNGMLFLPVRAEIRKQIKKQAGDWVHVCLYTDNDKLEIPQEFAHCLADEPQAADFFAGISESEQKNYINWIYGAKKEETKALRIEKTIEKLLQKKKFYDL